MFELFAMLDSQSQVNPGFCVVGQDGHGENEMKLVGGNVYAECETCPQSPAAVCETVCSLGRARAALPCALESGDTADARSSQEDSENCGQFNGDGTSDNCTRFWYKLDPAQYRGASETQVSALLACPHYPLGF